MSVAERVAAERGEQIGGTVGYTIRLESKCSANTKLLFCTTGILLKRLEEDPDLVGVTHVFVDEVHERSLESDFLLMVLRDLMRRRHDDPTCPKIVLMSATLDAELFNRYFGGAPSVKFPGRAFPVTDLYLEDAIELTRHVVRPGADWARKAGKPGGGGGGFGGGGGGADRPSGLCNDFKLGKCTRRDCKFGHGDAGGGAGGYRPGPGMGMGMVGGLGGAEGGFGGGGGFAAPSYPFGSSTNQTADPLNADDEALSLPELAARYPAHSATTHAALKALDHNAIDYELVSKVVQWAVTCKVDEAAKWAADRLGRSAEPQPNQPKPDAAKAALADAVLVFLPGEGGVDSVRDTISWTAS